MSAFLHAVMSVVLVWGMCTVLSIFNVAIYKICLFCQSI